jgi:hypothetical protein
MSRPSKRRSLELAVAIATIAAAIFGFLALFPAKPPKHAILSVADITSKEGVDDPSKGFVAMKLVNRGDATAEDMNVKFTCLASPYAMEEPWDFLKWPRLVKSPATTPLGPDDVTHVVCGFAKEHLRAIAEKTGFGYLVLNANYRDRDDGSSPHILQWSQHIVYAAKEPDEKSGYQLALTPHGKHNCVDDGCPE